MKILNCETKRSPNIIHAPGIYRWSHLNENPLWEPLCEYFFSTKKKHLGLPSDATIVTWNSSDNKAILEQSLDHLGIPHQVIRKKNWQNFDKILTTREFLNTVNTECIIWLDCFDIIVLNDLSEMVNVFLADNVKMYLNAEKRFWPDVELVEDSKAFQQKVNSKFSTKYLNTGACIARVDFLKEILDKCIKIRPTVLSTINSMTKGKKTWGGSDIAEIKGDDQIIFHMLFKEAYPKMKIDDECRFFQVIKYCSPLEIKYGKIFL
jgi:hypothetical protein